MQVIRSTSSLCRAVRSAPRAYRSYAPIRSFAAATRLSDESTAKAVKAKEPVPFPLSESDFINLKEEMKSRKLPLLYDVPHSGPISLFETTICDMTPSNYQLLKDQRGPRRFPKSGLAQTPIPFGYHLLYFLPQLSLSELLPDATDPAQSPGAPFDRRMWAGGSISSNKVSSVYPSEFARRRNLTPDSSTGIEEQSACLERVADVQLKGEGDSQKLFVTLERRIGAIPRVEASSLQDKNPQGTQAVISADTLPKDSKLAFAGSEQQIREWLENDDNVALVEKRNLVFMNNSKMPKPGSGSKKPAKVLKGPGAPEHSVSLVPTASLLFRFSALTFNAHRIHLDATYCREVEGHRNLVVHGPLSCMLLLETLRAHLERKFPGAFTTGYNYKASGSDAPHFLYNFEYRNVAPLYAEEEMRVCLRQKEADPKDEGKVVKYDLWVENSEGSMCVKGTAHCAVAGSSEAPDDAEGPPNETGYRKSA